MKYSIDPSIKLNEMCEEAGLELWQICCYLKNGDMKGEDDITKIFKAGVGMLYAKYHYSKEWLGKIIESDKKYKEQLEKCRSQGS